MPAQTETQRPLALVHHAARRERLVLAVIHHGQVEAARVLHRAAHHARRRDGPPVVRDGDDAGALHLAHLGQLLALRPLRDRADGEDVGEPGGLRLLDDETGHRRVVVDGVGVRHRADARAAARDGRRRARRDRLLVLLPRLAQVRVQVDEAGRDDEARSVEDLRALGPRLAATEQPGHAAVLDEHVQAGVDALRRVDHVSVCD